MKLNNIGTSMSNESNIYLFIDELFHGVNKFIPIEHMSVSFIQSDRSKILTIEPKTHTEKMILLDGPSITKITLETSLSFIENYLTDSFLYNQSVDNPFQYEADSIAAIPIILHDQKSICGTVSLFKIKEKDSKDYFTKKSISKISKLLKKRIEKSQTLFNDFSLLYINEPSASSAKPLDKSETELQLERNNEFFSSIIHDIRTPMNAVMGFLELLEEEADPKQIEYIKAAYKSGEMVVALINDVLDFNKIASGKFDIDLHYFSPVDELENSALLFYHSALKKRIDFITYFDPNIPYAIKSDPYRVKQIINNLLSNAIKFTPDEGMVVLELLYDEKYDILKIHVRDTGIGISKETQKNLFKPFQQASKNTSSQYGGTGLGLSISKKLANLLDGELSLESKEVEGTTFTLEIPCHSIQGTPPFLNFDFNEFPYIYIVDGSKSKHRYVNYYERYFETLNLPHEVLTPEELMKRNVEHESSVLIGIRFDYEESFTKSLINNYHEVLIILETNLFEKTSQIPTDVTILDMPVFPQKLFKAILNINEEEVQTRREEKKSDKRILLVDDNVINLKLMQEVSKRLGATPYTASDGKEAIKLFEKTDVDIILIDQNMPVINGTEAIKKIRSLPKGKTVSIYGLTGDSDSETLQQMIEAGADAILTKPVQIDKLRQILTA